MTRRSKYYASLQDRVFTRQSPRVLTHCVVARCTPDYDAYLDRLCGPWRLAQSVAHHALTGALTGDNVGDGHRPSDDGYFVLAWCESRARADKLAQRNRAARAIMVGDEVIGSSARRGVADGFYFYLDVLVLPLSLEVTL